MHSMNTRKAKPRVTEIEKIIKSHGEPKRPPLRSNVHLRKKYWIYAIMFLERNDKQ